MYFINNTLLSIWTTKTGGINYFVASTFALSFVSIVQNLINLIGLLYGEEIEVFYKCVRYLN